MTNSMTPTAKVIEIDGESYTLRFNFGSLCLAEKAMGENPLAAFADQGGGNYRVSLDAIGVIFWAALQSRHPMSRAQSDELIDAAGFTAAAQWVAEGLREYVGGGEAKSAEAGQAGNASKAGRKRP